MIIIIYICNYIYSISDFEEEASTEQLHDVDLGIGGQIQLRKEYSPKITEATPARLIRESPEFDLVEITEGRWRGFRVQVSHPLENGLIAPSQKILEIYDHEVGTIIDILDYHTLKVRFSDGGILILPRNEFRVCRPYPGGKVQLRHNYHGGMHDEVTTTAVGTILHVSNELELKVQFPGNVLTLPDGYFFLLGDLKLDKSPGYHHPVLCYDYTFFNLPDHQLGKNTKLMVGNRKQQHLAMRTAGELPPIFKDEAENRKMAILVEYDYVKNEYSFDFQGSHSAIDATHFVDVSEHSLETYYQQNFRIGDAVMIVGDDVENELVQNCAGVYIAWICDEQARSDFKFVVRMNHDGSFKQRSSKGMVLFDASAHLPVPEIAGGKLQANKKGELVIPTESPDFTYSYVLDTSPRARRGKVITLLTKIF